MQRLNAFHPEWMIERREAGKNIPVEEGRSFSASIFRKRVTDKEFAELKQAIADERWAAVLGDKPVKSHHDDYSAERGTIYPNMLQKSGGGDLSNNVAGISFGKLLCHNPHDRADPECIRDEKRIDINIALTFVHIGDRLLILSTRDVQDTPDPAFWQDYDDAWQEVIEESVQWTNRRNAQWARTVYRSNRNTNEQ